MIFAIAHAVLNFWSFGVMHNYAMKQNSQWAESVRKNRESEEGPLDIEEEIQLKKIANTLRPEDAPDWLAYISIVTTILGFIFLLRIGLLNKKIGRTERGCLVYRNEGQILRI
jgi:hypothetical protein